MKVINTFVQLNNLNGKPIQGEEGSPLTLGQFLISVLNNCPKEKNFPALKAFDLANRLYKENFVKLDEPDLKKLKTLVEESSQASIILIGQVLTLMDSKDVVDDE